MNSLYTKIIAGALLGTLIVAPLIAGAKNDSGNGAEVRVSSELKVNAGERRSSTSSVDIDRDDDSASSTNDIDDDIDRDNATSSVATSSTRGDDDADDGQGKEHRSRVATIVQGLLTVADRDGGIGADVRVVAREQASTTDTTVSAMETLDHENGFKKFLIGPDYKSLGELRSTIVTTDNRIDRLTKARDRAVSTTTRAAIDVQIIALTDVASSTQLYVKEHENVFSLLGWFFRLFNL